VYGALLDLDARGSSWGRADVLDHPDVPESAARTAADVIATLLDDDRAEIVERGRNGTRLCRLTVGRETDDSDERSEPNTDASASREASPVSSSSAHTPVRLETIENMSDSERTAALDAVDSLDLPGSGERLDERRGAVREVVCVLDDGGANTAELKEIGDSLPTGYESARSAWKNLYLPALQELQERGHVVLVDSHDGTRRLASR